MAVAAVKIVSLLLSWHQNPCCSLPPSQLPPLCSTDPHQDGTPAKVQHSNKPAVAASTTAVRGAWPCFTAVSPHAPSVVVLYPRADKNVADGGIVLLETTRCPRVDDQIGLDRLRGTEKNNHDFFRARHQRGAAFGGST